MATINYKDIYSVLSEQDQLHLLKYYGELTPERQQALLEQISTIDWDLIPDFATCSILTIEKNVENTAFGLYFFNFML